jgi:hypothetical protein
MLIPTRQNPHLLLESASPISPVIGDAVLLDVSPISCEVKATRLVNLHLLYLFERRYGLTMRVFHSPSYRRHCPLSPSPALFRPRPLPLSASPCTTLPDGQPAALAHLCPCAPACCGWPAVHLLRPSLLTGVASAPARASLLASSTRVLCPTGGTPPSPLASRQRGKRFSLRLDSCHLRMCVAAGRWHTSAPRSSPVWRRSTPACASHLAIDAQRELYCRLRGAVDVVAHPGPLQASWPPPTAPPASLPPPSPSPIRTVTGNAV